MTRLIDEEILEDGSRLILIEANEPEFWPCITYADGHKSYVHGCTIGAEGFPVCSNCGDVIPPPPGLRI